VYDFTFAGIERHVGHINGANCAWQMTVTYKHSFWYFLSTINTFEILVVLKIYYQNDSCIIKCGPYRMQWYERE
jgi:hypothetical protein